MSPSKKELYPSSQNEVKAPRLIARSVFFAPSVAMRLAPEILMLELYREIFFDSHVGSSRASGIEMDPYGTTDTGDALHETSERAVLNVLRGRRRKVKNATTRPFYCPTYPPTARHAWLGKRRERIVYRLLFEGALAQHFSQPPNPDGLQSMAKDLALALAGNHRWIDAGPEGNEILSVAIGRELNVSDLEAPETRIVEKCTTDGVLQHQDPLSTRISLDLTALCALERSVPRIQWLQLMMAFLRTALPLWYLSKLRLTSELYIWLREALEEGRVPSEEEIRKSVERRGFRLLTPTLTPTREIFTSIEKYVRDRIELNILLYLLRRTCGPKVLPDSAVLTLFREGQDRVSTPELLRIAAKARSNVKKDKDFVAKVGDGSIADYLTRVGEGYHAWRNPLNRGQGKNIDEFMRVLYRDELGDEAGGYLLTPHGRGEQRGFRVFPGQLLLKTFICLAEHEKMRRTDIRGGGRLSLQDVEDHFQMYGIDFGYAADARPLLIRELQDMGLLAGSPDAGSSVIVSSPY